MGDDVVPQSPQTTPYGIGAGQPGHDFTLQAVMELQKSVAEMNSSLVAVRASVDSMKSKLDDLMVWKNKIIGGAIVLGAVVTLLGFLTGKASEYLTLKPIAATTGSAPVQMPQAAEPPASK